MKKLYALSLVALLTFSTSSFAGDNKGNDEKMNRDKSAVSGVILDAANSEALTGARLFVHELKKEVYADFDGQFTLGEIKPGTYTLTVSLLSYTEHTFQQVEIGKEKSLGALYLHAK